MNEDKTLNVNIRPHFAIPRKRIFSGTSLYAFHTYNMWKHKKILSNFEQYLERTITNFNYIRVGELKFFEMKKKSIC